MSKNTSKSPKVTVIIPNFNRDYCLGRAIRSVVNQTFSDWNLIVVDNNSTDGSLEVIGSFNDSRISVVRTDNNGIIAHSRNIGIRKAKGDYIAFLDSDDWWEITKLQESIACLDSGSDFVYHDLYQVSRLPEKESAQGIIRTRALTTPVFVDLLSNGNTIPNSSVVVRTSLVREIGGFSEKSELVGSEDFDGWIRIAKLTNKFHRLDSVLGYYWNGGGNLTSAKTALANYIYLRNRYEKELNNILGQELPGWMVYGLARAALTLGKFSEARRYSLLALKTKLPKLIRLKAAVTWTMSVIRFRG